MKMISTPPKIASDMPAGRIDVFAAARHESESPNIPKISEKIAGGVCSPKPVFERITFPLQHISQAIRPSRPKPKINNVAGLPKTRRRSTLRPNDRSIP